MSRLKRHTRTAVIFCALGLVSAGFYVRHTPMLQAGPDDFYGHSVAPAVAVRAATFEVARDCRIRRFGVAPWRLADSPRDARWAEMTRLALIAQGLPESAVPKAITALRTAPHRQIQMGNLGSVDGMYAPVFDSTWRMGDRYVACLDSQPRFKDDSTTASASVWFIEHDGRVYHLGEPHACGNVSIFRVNPGRACAVPLSPLPNASTPILPPFSSRPGIVPRGTLPPGVGFIPPPGAPDCFGPPVQPVPVVVHEVPEPSTVALILLALIGIVLTKRSPSRK